MNRGVETVGAGAEMIGGEKLARTTATATTNSWDIAARLEDTSPSKHKVLPKEEVYESADHKFLIERVNRCSCITRGQLNMRDIRLYDVDRTSSHPHGLRHELQNYQTMVIEALISRRLFLASKSSPQFDLIHNFGQQITKTHWEDYLSLSSSTIVIEDRTTGLTPTVVCKAALADCVVSRNESNAIIEVINRLGATQPVLWQAQIVPKDAPTLESQSILFLRAPEDTRLYGTLPFAKDLDLKYAVNLTLVRPDSTRKMAKDILSTMQHKQAEVVVAHVRRGDKVAGPTAVKGLDESTSSDNIISVLHQVAPPSSTVYIMTNEWKSYFFDPVRAQYTVLMWSDFKPLRDLMSGCPIPFYPWAAANACESLVGYQVEEELMDLIHPSKRIVTFYSEADYHYRHFHRAPYLHPVGEFSPPTTRQWCKANGESCKYVVHCCSLRCEEMVPGSSWSRVCMDWEPPPPQTTTLAAAAH
jgi:hypothetical protein